jgi:Asp-tRNA(Asn)/Glu-tRNA(Gln) amidotransferase A subunit family amidase
MHVPHRLSLRAMLEALASGRLSPPELLRAHLDQIERLNPALNAFVSVAPAPGKETHAGRVPAHGTPLAGIPFTAKDSFDVKGEPTLCGSLFRSTHRAARNSTAVRRMLHAGAVFLGKTNCPELLANWETDNHIQGRTNNPWNLDLTPGGSSGGEAAAIAAFCSPAGLGSDGGGSIRWPAHCTGICGLKPTPGRVSGAGHFPAIVHPGGLLGVAGPMARTVDDLSILFPVLAGYDVEDPFSIPFVPPKTGIEGIRVGVVDRFPLQPACRMALESAARLLSEAGLPVEPFPDFPLDRAHECWFFFFARLGAAYVSELAEKREHQAHWTGLELYRMVCHDPAPTGAEVVRQLAARDRLRSGFLRQMHTHAVLLAPVASVTAFPHRARRFQTELGEIDYLNALKPLTFVNLLGLPSLSIPMVVHEGVPAGIQLIGAPYREELLLALGRRLEEARGALPASPMASP